MTDINNRMNGMVSLSGSDAIVKTREVATIIGVHAMDRLKALEKNALKSIESARKLFVKDEIILRLHDDTEHPNYGVGFSTIIFRKKEWYALKRFCQVHSIYQTDLNGLFNRWLENDEAKIRSFSVALRDVQAKFLGYSILMQEISDVYFPQIFLNEYEGLHPCQVFDEISFARFAIYGFIFCAQAFPDVLYDFFAITKQNYNTKIVSTIFTFNLSKILTVLSNDVSPAFQPIMNYLIEHSNIIDSDEISIATMMKFAVKYPLMFYQIYRFRGYMRRLIFGEKFWSLRLDLVTRFQDIEEYYHAVDKDIFKNEQTTARATARAILFDILLCDSMDKIPLSTTPVDMNYFLAMDPGASSQAIQSRYNNTKSVKSETSSKKSLKLKKKKANMSSKSLVSNTTTDDQLMQHSVEHQTDPTPATPEPSLSDTACLRIKHYLGYKNAKKIIQASDLQCPANQLFLHTPMEYPPESRGYDSKMQRDFVYDLGTGMRAWVQEFVDPAGELLRETAWNVKPPKRVASTTQI